VFAYAGEINMIPFTVSLKPRSPISEQLAYAVKKAIVFGQLKPGDRMVSVRGLSQELRINPNTAQKAFTRLANEGLIEVRPGIGYTIAAFQKKTTDEQRDDILEDEIERLVVEAKSLRLNKEYLIRAINRHWSRMSVTDPERLHLGVLSK
jgi:GntR family transcriptional regulator